MARTSTDDVTGDRTNEIKPNCRSSGNDGAGGVDDSGAVSAIRAEAVLRQARTMRLPTLQAGGSYKYISDIPRLEVPPPPVPGFQFPEIQAGANNQYDLYTIS